MKNLANWLGGFILTCGIFNFISYMIFALQSNDKSFSRLFLSMVCFGFAGIILKLKD